MNIARAAVGRIAIDRTKLTVGSREFEMAQLCAGRPSDAPLVHEIFRERRARNLPVTNQRIEAREIRAEAAARHPDRDPPAVKTIERHLRQSNEQN